MRRMRACGHPLLVSFLCRGCVRGRSGASYFPCICLDKDLAVVNDADESCLSKLCESLQQGLEERGVVGPRGGVVVGALDFSSILACSISGLVADRAWARWHCVLVKMLPSWPMGMATN